VGNISKSDHYSEQDMYNELVNLADKGEIDRNKIPKVQTIKGWISRFSRQIKKKWLKSQKIIKKVLKVIKG